MDRRQVLQGLAGILACGVAPAYAGSGVLMPIKQLILPRLVTLDWRVETVIPVEITLAELAAMVSKLPSNSPIGQDIREVLAEMPRTKAALADAFQRKLENP